MAESVGQLLDANQTRIESILPDYLTPKRWFALARSVEKNPALAKCTPQSVLDAIIKCADWGLEIGGPDDHVVLIPYRNSDTGEIEAQAQPMYRGIIYRLIRAGIVSHMYAELVHEGDQVDVISGTKRELIHKPNVFGAPGKMIGCYAVAVLPNGITDFELMGLRDLEAIKAAAKRMAERRKPGGGLSPAWRDFEGEMFKKSAIRRLAKRLQGERRVSDPEEAERLGKVLRADNEDFAFEDARPVAADDMPKGVPAIPADKPRAVKPETVTPAPKAKPEAKPNGPAAPAPDEPIGEGRDYDDLLDQMGVLGLKASALKRICRDQFGCNDPSELKRSRVAAFSEAMQKEAGT